MPYQLMGQSDAVIAAPMFHEEYQIGWAIACPVCDHDIRVPISDFLAEGPQKWVVPPQNMDFSDGGWFQAWGTHRDLSGLTLRMNERSSGPDQIVVCRFCGKGFAVSEGTIQEIE
jgi:hypothetical protein